MSLFDIIKYSNTDLGNADVLEALPEDLLQLYWNNAPNQRPDLNSRHRLHNQKCGMLAYSYLYKFKNQRYYKKAFKKSCMEYNQ